MKLSAENKHVSAQFLLGLFYKCGIGTPVNHEKAFYWFNLAAENGYEQSYSHIGRYYLDGRIVKTNYENAALWFEKAITSQNENVRGEALFDYGVLYLDGLGVSKNREKAIGYFVESKKLGCLNAINKLKELEAENILTFYANRFSARRCAFCLSLHKSLLQHYNIRCSSIRYGQR